MKQLQEIFYLNLAKWSLPFSSRNKAGGSDGTVLQNEKKEHTEQSVIFFA